MSKLAFATILGLLVLGVQALAQPAQICSAKAEDKTCVPSPRGTPAGRASIIVTQGFDNPICRAAAEIVSLLPRQTVSNPERDFVLADIDKAVKGRAKRLEEFLIWSEKDDAPIRLLIEDLNNDGEKDSLVILTLNFYGEALNEAYFFAPSRKLDADELRRAIVASSQSSWNYLSRNFEPLQIKKPGSPTVHFTDQTISVMVPLIWQNTVFLLTWARRSTLSVTDKNEDSLRVITIQDARRQNLDCMFVPEPGWKRARPR